MPIQTEKELPIEQMPNLRLFYRKRGRAKYISHLDITRCMQRSLKRAGLPVWYTQGFNPHMYMTFALPLALGYESDYECMDLRFTHLMEFEEIQTRLNAALPRDIQVWKVDLAGFLRLLRATGNPHPEAHQKGNENGGPEAGIHLAGP